MQKGTLRREVGRAADSIRGAVHNLTHRAERTREDIKDTSERASKEAREAMKDVQGKTEDIKREAKHGYSDMKQGINRTIQRFSKKIKKS